jgi:hypothetical protein
MGTRQRLQDSIDQGRMSILVRKIPVLSDKERAELFASLKEAEDRVRAGKGVPYESKAFKRRLIRIYRGSER